LQQIAERHRVGIANVGLRAILDQKAVAGLIVGARLGIAEHIAENARTFDFMLNEGDLAALDPVFAKSRDLLALIGDCGAEYR
jgi:aryl-alcohol dehydrogenase-like predicted oxidoreductase